MKIRAVVTDIHLMDGAVYCNPATEAYLKEAVTITREELRQRWENNQSLALSCHPNGCDWLIEELFGSETKEH